MFLNYFSLGMLFFVFLIIFYGVIMIHDIPYIIAKKRNHPHADAIHTAGWLACLHCISSGLFCGSGPRSINQNVGGACRRMPLSLREILI